MSRSGYSDECENLGLWRGAVERAIKGKRGQAMLRDLLAALDAMPEKALVADSLVTAEGEFCTLGALGRVRGIDMTKLDPEDRESVAGAFGIATAMAQEIVYMNDEYEDGHRCWSGRWVYEPETDEERFERMRAWVAKQIKEAP